MKQERQIIAIAKACGWIQHDIPDEWSSGEPSGAFFWKSADGKFSSAPPNYTGSLDAMHEAELHLWRTNPTQYWTYADIMLKEVVWKNGAPGTAYQCATAAQRAEAFLRTVEKWVEEETAL